MFVYQWAKMTYDEKDVLTARIHSLSTQLKQAELETALVKDQFFGFRQEVAMNLPTLLPSLKDSAQGYAARSIASVTQKPGLKNQEASQEVLAELSFSKAKNAFQTKNFEKSEHLLKEFIRRYGFSTHAPDAHFLLVESLYQQGKAEETVEAIRKVIDLFPGHEVAGFSMIRLGKIMEDQGQAGNAADIYKKVIRSFPQREVASLAAASLAGVNF